MIYFLFVLVLLLPFNAAAQDLKHSVIAGYQAWFRTSCDTEFSGWEHWNGGTSPSPGNITFELWPDMREYAGGDVCATGLANLGNGSGDTLYAAGRTGVINLHFSWMQQYGIDGIALQRFLSAATQGGVAVAGFRVWRDATLQRVKTAAETYGRTFYVMIDLSGAASATLVSDLQADVTHIESLSGNPMGSANYLTQDGKKVINVYGCGFIGVGCDRPKAQTIITWLKARGYYVVLGIPHWWNRSDVDPDQPNWLTTYMMADMILPWSVGNYSTDGEVDSYFSGRVVTDKAVADANGVGYQITMFPGFSWSNWNGGSPNMIPRRAGALMWRQAYRVKEQGLGYAYIGMFDEWDEATAIAKAAETSAMIPTNQYFLTLDADGTAMSSSFYLRLSGDLTRMIKGLDPWTLTIPTPFVETGGDTSPPTAPSNLGLSVISSSRIDLTWDASTDDTAVTGYKVERCTGVGCVNFAEITAPATNSYSNTGLTTATLYRYRVRATDAASNLSAYSSIAQATTSGTGAAIVRTGSCVASATSCTLSAVATGDLVLTFAFRNGSSTAPSADANNTTIRTVVTSNSGVRAAYRLSCRKATGSGDNSSGIYANATDVISIAYANTDINTTADCAGTALGTLGGTGSGTNWAKTSTTANFPAMTLEKTDGTSWIAVFVGVTGASVCTPSGLTSVVSGTRTRVSDTNAAVSSWSAHTCTVASSTWMTDTVEVVGIPAPPGDTTPPSQPTNLVATAVSVSQINLTWTAATDESGGSGLTGYRVERCAGAGCVNFAEIDTDTDTSYPSIGLSSVTLYRYRVRATDAANNLGAYSNVSEATTLAPGIGGGALLTANDLDYIGAFRLPAGNFTGASQTFEFAGGFVSGNVYEDPTNGKSLFIPGLLSAGYVSTTVSIAQIQIPTTILDPDIVGIAGLTTASVIQNFDDPSNGAGTTALLGNGFGTLLNYGGKIIGTESIAYDATCTQTHSAWVSSPNFANKSSATGPYAFSAPVGIGPRWQGGAYMAMIPSEWQSALGGKVVSGSGPWSIVGCGSPGPTLFVIDADYLITQPSTTPLVSTTALVYYAENSTQATLGHWNSNDPTQVVNGVTVPSITVTDPFGRGTFTIPYEDNAMRVSGVLFPEGSRSVLFFGYKGLGPYCYGTGTADPKLHGTPDGAGGVYCYDEDGVGGKGDHSYPYTSFVWAYDVNDFVAAKNGTKNAWQVYPYTGWTFKYPQATSSYKYVGVSWDPITRRAYMVVGNADAAHGSTPLVHVYSVTTPAAPSGLIVSGRRRVN